MTKPAKSRGPRPDFCFNGVVDMQPRWLSQIGIRGLLLDIDNTITRWEQVRVPEGEIDWLKTIQHEGIEVRLLSNGFPSKKTRVIRQTGIDHVATLLIKPFPIVFRVALRELAMSPHKVMMVGDSIFTDIFPANRLGIWTCLVDPLSDVDFPGTKINRLLETGFHLRDPLYTENDHRRSAAGRQEAASALAAAEATEQTTGIE